MVNASAQGETIEDQLAAYGASACRGIVLSKMDEAVKLGPALDALIRRTWKPTLSVTGVDGFPEMRSAGNVLRPYTAFKLSLRLPPLIDGNEAAARLKALLEDNAPYNAKVTFAADGRVGAQGACQRAKSVPGSG